MTKIPLSLKMTKIPLSNQNPLTPNKIHTDTNNRTQTRINTYNK